MSFKFWLLFVLLLCCCLPFVQALQVSPSNLNERLFVSIPRTINLSLTNNHAFGIYEINSTLDGWGGQYFFPFVQELSAGNSSVFGLNLSCNTSFSWVGNLSFFYKYNSSVTLNSSTRIINITSSDGLGGDMNLSRGSTLIWVNNDTVQHRLSCALFDVTLSQGTNFTYQFGSVGSWQVADSLNALSQNIVVGSDVVNVSMHNPDFDVVVPVNLSCLFVETALDVSLVEPSNGELSVEANENKDGVLKIFNSGSKPAINVSLLGNWTVFGRQNFNVSANESKFIPFTVSPYLVNSSGTNQSYDLLLVVSSMNAEQRTTTLKVFVPWSSSTSVDNSSLDFFAQKKVFCDAYPQSPLCLASPLIEYRNVTVVQEAVLPYNYTQSEVNELNRHWLEVGDILRRQDNLYKSVLDDINSRMDVVANQTNQVGVIADEVKRLKDSQSGLSGMIWGTILVLVFVFVIGLGGVFFWYFWNIKKKKGVIET